MILPYIRGITTKQAHVSVPDGTVEEECARKVFSAMQVRMSFCFQFKLCAWPIDLFDGLARE